MKALKNLKDVITSDRRSKSGLISPRGPSSSSSTSSSSTEKTEPRTARSSTLLNSNKTSARKKKKKAPIFADCYQELPDDVKKTLDKEKITATEVDENWKSMCRILKFLTRREVKRSEDKVGMPTGLVHKVHLDLSNLEQCDEIIQKLLDGTGKADDDEEDDEEELLDPKSFYMRTRWMDSRASLLVNDNPKKIYRNIAFSGSGAFGTVNKAFDSSKNAVAIKVIGNDSPKEQQTNLHELSVLKFCEHPNICKFYTAYLFENQIWAVLEYLEGGTLSEAAKKHEFTEHEISYAAKNILRGVKYLHQNNLIHRDIKSANVMMTVKGHVKLIDFGLVADYSIDPERRKEILGSPMWIPPEMIKAELHDFKVDIWSTAVCLLELCHGEARHHETPFRHMLNVATVGFVAPFESPDRQSHFFRDFIARCLVVDPQKRASAAELLEDPFILKGNVTETEMKDILSDIFVQQAVESMIL